ncbi:unnamed protein product [Schistocephalus solidus]|uniref:Ig-like domain-containing protein n=1 Tax=Schistocephalus solidus TaxID=70667 RepID=A0A0V0J548_SCHSO|nr:unnamed protein product [Schistocephalus solidus]
MFTKIAFISILCWLNAMAAKHPNFPQWDQTPWVVSSVPEKISLSCVHEDFYPFNSLESAAIKTVWILPKETSYLHLAPGNKTEGWSAEPKALVIQKSFFNVPSAVDGMYVCAVLAKVPNSKDLFSWYYLRWGVGLYSHVPAMNPGGIERYTRQFTIAGVAVAVYSVLAIGFGLTMFFRYKGGPVKEEDEEDSSAESILSEKHTQEHVVHF